MDSGCYYRVRDYLKQHVTLRPSNVPEIRAFSGIGKITGPSMKLRPTMPLCLTHRRKLLPKKGTFVLLGQDVITKRIAHKLAERMQRLPLHTDVKQRLISAALLPCLTFDLVVEPLPIAHLCALVLREPCMSRVVSIAGICYALRLRACLEMLLLLGCSNPSYPLETDVETDGERLTLWEAYLSYL